VASCADPVLDSNLDFAMNQYRIASRAVFLTVMGVALAGGMAMASTAQAQLAQPQGSNAVRVGGAIRAPAIIKRVNPTYPDDARAARVQGVVIIEATVSANGTVADARVLRSVPMLDQAALDAVRQWVYEPTRVNGVAVPVIMTVTVNFTLGMSESASVTLRVTDTKGTVVLVKEATIDYADAALAASPSAGTAPPPTTSEGIRIYQGEGQTIVKWSSIARMTFTPADKTDKADKAGTPSRLKGELVLTNGQRMPAEFVLPKKGGGLKGTTDLGAYTIAFSDIAQIALVPANQK
jgi:TonB family protein